MGKKRQQLLADELEKLDWTQADLHARPKGAAQKIRIAQRLRRETTMTLDWIAQALYMGTKTYLSHLLYWEGREKNQRRGGTRA